MKSIFYNHGCFIVLICIIITSIYVYCNILNSKLNLEFFIPNNPSMSEYYVKKINCFCTMKSCVNITKIKRKNGGYKYPKLKELYEYIFGSEPKNLHNSLYDTRYTLDCLKELYYNDLIKLFV